MCILEIFKNIRGEKRNSNIAIGCFFEQATEDERA